MQIVRRITAGESSKMTTKTGPDMVTLRHIEIVRAPLLDLVEIRCWSRRLAGTKAPPTRLRMDTATARRLRGALDSLLEHEASNKQVAALTAEAKEVFGIEIDHTEETEELGNGLSNLS